MPRWRRTPRKQQAADTRPPAPATAEEHEARLSAFWARWRASDRRWSYLLRHPGETTAAVVDVLALPRLDAELTDTPEGRLLHQYLTRRVGGLPLGATGACVLDVPEDPAAYSLGASRQTLRRKVRAAERAGVTWRRVQDAADERRLVQLLDDALARKSEQYRREGTDHTFMLGTGLWHVAENRDGVPLVLAVTPHAGRWALLLCFIALGESDEHSNARYLLTKVVVEALAELGVRHLVDTVPPSGLANGLRHFQRMLGFRITRVRCTLTGPVSAAPVLTEELPPVRMVSRTQSRTSQKQDV